MAESIILLCLFLFPERLGVKNIAKATALITVGFCLLGISGDGFCDRLPIIIDGQFSDWEDAPVAYTDQSGDAFGGIDFGEIRLADDNEFLFLSFVMTRLTVSMVRPR